MCAERNVPQDLYRCAAIRQEKNEELLRDNRSLPRYYWTHETRSKSQQDSETRAHPTNYKERRSGNRQGSGVAARGQTKTYVGHAEMHFDVT